MNVETLTNPSTSMRRRPLTRSLLRAQHQKQPNGVEAPSSNEPQSIPQTHESKPDLAAQQVLPSLNSTTLLNHSTTTPPQRLCICIVSDFFLPRLGGVELHQYQLAQALIARGHKVIVVTGSYGNNYERQGIRYLTQGLKVYYCPQIAFHNQVSVPTLYGFFPVFRSILLRERVDVVHGHQTTSPLAHQCLLMAKLFPHIRTVYTDHSLFNFASPASVHVNKLLRFTLFTLDHVIAVSHTLRENVVLRAGIPAENVSTIPNAIDHTRFRPPHTLDGAKHTKTAFAKDADSTSQSIGTTTQTEPDTPLDVSDQAELIRRATPPLLKDCRHCLEWKFRCDRDAVNTLIESVSYSSIAFQLHASTDNNDINPKTSGATQEDAVSHGDAAYGRDAVYGGDAGYGRVAVDEEGWPLAYRAQIEVEMERLANMCENRGADDGESGRVERDGLDEGGSECNGDICGDMCGDVDPTRSAADRAELEGHVMLVPQLSDPSSLRPHPHRVRAVILSRLVYRKGLELACTAIPILCHRHPYLDFIVGGDGPHRPLLEAMVRKNKLENRVFFLGEVPHHRVSEVLAAGDFFMNTSLTESFCIAILEAAAAGLPVVSTRVGGVPEILPPGIIHFSDPNPVSLAMTVDALLCRYCVKCVNKHALHAIVANSYSWHYVAQRTERVYLDAMQRPSRHPIDHAAQYWSLNSWSGRIWAGVIALGMCILQLCMWLWPESEIDVVPDVDRGVLLQSLCSRYTADNPDADAGSNMPPSESTQ